MIKFLQIENLQILQIFIIPLTIAFSKYATLDCIERDFYSSQNKY